MISLININEVTKRTALSKSSIYDLARRGLFPKQIKIGLRRVGWLESEIENWLQDKVQSSQNG